MIKLPLFEFQFLGPDELLPLVLKQIADHLAGSLCVILKRCDTDEEQTLFPHILKREEGRFSRPSSLMLMPSGTHYKDL